MRSAIEASPTDARLFANLGSILAAVNTGGHRSEAVEAFKQSLQLDPTQVKLRAQVVDMLASMGRTKEASALMEASGAGKGDAMMEGAKADCLRCLIFCLVLFLYVLGDIPLDV
jgi:thioredoxin-like negative regulator of GroEL